MRDRSRRRAIPLSRMRGRALSGDALDFNKEDLMRNPAAQVYRRLSIVLCGVSVTAALGCGD
ncbi:MAG TPA: hypothetical protein VK550_18130, partial [Polyangiaceae bacterium]|nr:hypothetical protein [Polyangiaceae bacterium]